MINMQCKYDLTPNNINIKINIYPFMSSFLSPKKKIILTRHRGTRKPENRTATFGGCLLPHTSPLDVSQPSPIPPLIQKEGFSLLQRVCESVRFYQQLSVVESFNLIKNRSEGLLKSQMYLEEKRRRRAIIRAINKLRSNKEAQSQVAEEELCRKQPGNAQSRYVDLQSYRDLQERVNQLESMIKQNGHCNPRHRPLDNKENKENRERRKYVLDFPEVSTDSGVSRVIHNYHSPLGRRSINIDESNDDLSFLSFRTSKEKERDSKVSPSLFKSRFIQRLG